MCFFVRKTTLFREKKLVGPRLALNCVGGANSTELGKVLSPGGIHVTYGGMSMKPVTAATSALIFKDTQFRGFWLSRWKQQNQAGTSARREMEQFLTAIALSGELRPPKHVLVPVSDFKTALVAAQKGKKEGKFILDMRNEQ
jgi:trans-2-enoyl-CoA reductase